MDRSTGQARQHFLQQLDALGTGLGVENGKSGDVILLPS